MGNRSRSSERYRKRNLSRSRSRDSIRKDSHRDRRSSSYTEKEHRDKYRDSRSRPDSVRRDSYHHSSKYSGHSDHLNKDHHVHRKSRHDKHSRSDKYSETRSDRYHDRESTLGSARHPRDHRSPSYSKSSKPDYKKVHKRDHSHDSEGRHERKHERRSRSVSLGHSDERLENTEELKDEEELLKSMMGISSFETTKNKKHEETSVSGVKKKSKRKYRQYMNRRGGFNHPLSPVF